MPGHLTTFGFGIVMEHTHVVEQIVYEPHQSQEGTSTTLVIGELLILSQVFVVKAVQLVDSQVYFVLYHFKYQLFIQFIFISLSYLDFLIYVIECLFH